MAAAAALADERLKRSVIFVTFTGEEHDLLGSIWFVASGSVDVRDLDLMVNADMVGRNPTQPVVIYQGGQMPFAGADLASLAAQAELDARVVTAGFGGSDHTPFETSGIPVVFPFSGFHPDYHGVDDEEDRIDYDRLADVSAFITNVVEAAAAQ
jgi:Zn-dependent M28 family amino/carboxypeptidase